MSGNQQFSAKSHGRPISPANSPQNDTIPPIFSLKEVKSTSFQQTMKKLLSIFMITAAACAAGCSSAGPNAAAGNSSNAAPSTPPATPAPAVSAANFNTNSNTAQDTGPQRISFAKGANWGTANVTLAPGTAKKFVVSAKSGQTMDVELSSKETSVNLIKGKAETTEDFGYLNAELKSNGDYVFEVRNSTKKEVKTSVKVTIESPSDEPDEQ